MKKAQKEQIKAGGEMARARYQKFLRRPEWLTGLSDEERELAIKILGNHTNAETMLLDKTAKGKTLREVVEDVQRIRVIHKLECLLRYGATAELALYGYDN